MTTERTNKTHQILNDLKDVINEIKLESAITNNKVDTINNTVKRIETNLERNYVTKAESSYITDRLSKVESNMAWISRLIIGMVVTAVLGLVISQGGL